MRSDHRVVLSTGAAHVVSAADASRLMQGMMHGPAFVTVALDGEEATLAVDHVVVLRAIADDAAAEAE